MCYGAVSRRPLLKQPAMLPGMHAHVLYWSCPFRASRVPLVQILKLRRTEEMKDTPWSAWSIVEVMTNIHSTSPYQPDGVTFLARCYSSLASVVNSKYLFCSQQAWAAERGYFTAKAGRPDAYRAAVDILHHAGKHGGGDRTTSLQGDFSKPRVSWCKTNTDKSREEARFASLEAHPSFTAYTRATWAGDTLLLGATPSISPTAYLFPIGAVDCRCVLSLLPPGSDPSIVRRR